MGKHDKKAEGDRYVQWKAQQILEQARERDRLEQAKQDRFKFWKTTAPPAPTVAAIAPPAPTPPPPSGIVAPTKREEPTKKEGLDKLKFWKKSEKPDTTVMIKDFQTQNQQPPPAPPPRKPIVYKAPLRTRISHSLSTKMPRVNLLGCKLGTVIVLIVLFILAVIFVPIILKVASIAL